MDKKKINSHLLEFIYSNQRVLLIVSIILIVVSAVFNTLNIDKNYLYVDVLSLVLGQIGGSTLSIVIITFSYEKWKEKKEDTNKYYLMNSSIFEQGAELTKYNFFQLFQGNKILPIMTSEQLYTGGYRFAKMLDNTKLSIKTPVLIYGTSASFLSNNIDGLLKSVKSGISFSFALVDPHNKNISDNVRKEIELSIDAIQDIIMNLDKGKINGIGTLELRFSPNITLHSFSSFEYDNNRKVRTLDFNFLNKEADQDVPVKYSQVFDTISGQDKELEKISDMLYYQYLSLYNNSIPVLRYPIDNHNIKIYICGLRQKKQATKYVVVYEEHIPIITYDRIDSDFINEFVRDSYRHRTGYKIQLKFAVNIKKENSYFLIGLVENTKSIENVSEISLKAWLQNEKNILSNLGINTSELKLLINRI